MLNFDNTEVAFSGKSNADLKKARILFKTLGNSSLVNLSKSLVEISLKLRLPMAWIIKPTIYNQFVGGESIEDCAKAIETLYKFNITSVLDYSAEGGSEEDDIKRVYAETIRAIEYSKGNKNIAYSVFKPTGIINNPLLQKVSEKEGELTEDESIKYKEFRERFFGLCQKASDCNVRILIDAEHYCYQDAIDLITEEAMIHFNKEKAVVFMTLQMYRHDRYEYLQKIFRDSQEKSYISGVKFVRGAYMEQERERAQEKGYPSPICATKEKTDENFDIGVKFVMDNIDKFELFCGTHNAKSCQLLVDQMKKYKLKKDDPRIYFAQLYGMSDNLSFNLSNEKYNVTKYLPYAPVNKVLPYLIRRAEENTSVKGQTGRELSLINSELQRRRKA